MPNDGAVKRACRVLGLEPGASPLAARRRYRELMRRWHPDLHRQNALAQAEATRQAQQINGAYRTLKAAAQRHEVPLRRPRPPAARPSAATGSRAATPLDETTLAERVAAGAVGLCLGLLAAFWLGSDRPAVWLAVVLTLGTAAFAFGWAFVSLVLRFLWWLP